MEPNMHSPNFFSGAKNYEQNKIERFPDIW